MTPSDADADGQLESLEAFGARAQAWIAQNLRPRRETPVSREEAQATGKALQAKIFDAGFAGVAIPKAYGGLGLTLDHQRVWAEATRDYETPGNYMVSIGMMLPTVLDHGSEAVKRRPSLVSRSSIGSRLRTVRTGSSLRTQSRIAVDAVTGSSSRTSPTAGSTLATGSTEERMMTKPIKALQKPATIQGSVNANRISPAISKKPNPPGDSANAAR